MGSSWDQARFDVRVDWGLRGALEVGPGACLAVVADVLSFTTCVTVAAARGIAVRPYRWRDQGAAAEADAAAATLAVPRQNAGPGDLSLSPLSLATASGVDRVVLPSPNGSTICEALADAGVPVVAASLLNASAVGRWLARRPGPVALIAAGERWAEDASLRPAVEDLYAVGAVVNVLAAADPARSPSPEAQVARAASEAVRGRLVEALQACASGRELIERGYAEDVVMAAQADATDVVPVLRDGWFRG